MTGLFHYRLVKIDEVIAQNPFAHREEFANIPIIQKGGPPPHALWPKESHLDQERSKLEISIHSCEIKSIISIKKHLLFEVEILYIVQKELVIQRPELKPLELEFLFRRKFKKVVKQKKKILASSTLMTHSSVISLTSKERIALT